MRLPASYLRHADHYGVVDALQHNPPAPNGINSQDSDFFYTWEIHTVQGDGTNTSILGHKAHTCRVWTSFNFAWIPNVDCEYFDDLGLKPSSSRTAWADLQIIPDGNCGIEQRALFLKQLGGLGCRSWIDEVSIFKSFTIEAHLRTWSGWFDTKLHSVCTCARS